tara:strand:- start:1917 stop:2606 length:690 start_codon:yes stop_codon:yes gene_type:complete
MVKVVVIDKNSNKKETVLNYDRNEFYKKCNYRNNNNFDARHTWQFKESGETYYVTVFAKDKGRANSENKYDLPPPIDSVLYYGTLLIVKTFTNENFEKDNLDNITLEEWEKCYEKLFGGFESLGEDDSEEIDELDDISDSEKTKEGYHKDGFVVDDDDDDDEDYIPDDEEEESEAEDTEETDEEVMGQDSEIDDEEEEEDDDEEEYESEEAELLDSELSEESYISDEDE